MFATGFRRFRSIVTTATTAGLDHSVISKLVNAWIATAMTVGLNVSRTAAT